MFSFPKTARVRRRLEFRKVLDHGVKVVSPEMVVFVKVREAGSAAAEPRLGLIVSRKVGGAVTRNRVKRQLRESFRHVASELRERAGFADADLVVIARHIAGERDFAGLDKAFKNSIRRLEKLRRKETDAPNDTRRHGS